MAMTPVERRYTIEALQSDERRYVSTLPDDELGTYSVWLRRHAIMADEDELPNWVCRWVELRSNVAQEELAWRRRAERRGGPVITRGNYRERVEQLRQHTSIVESILVSGVHIEKRGKEWMGLCPFHEDRSPSLSVNEESRVWHCFGCGEGGDVFRFMELRLNIPFPEAVKAVEAHAIAETAYGRSV